MKLINMTWDEVRKYLKTKDILIIPVGSIEQHGPMAPLGTDSFTSEEIAKRVGDKLDLLVAPTIMMGYVEPKFQRFHGTVCIRPETFSNLLEDTLVSFSRQGFKNFLIINGHEQNRPLISQVSQRLCQLEGIKVLSLEFWYLLEEELKDIASSELIHACEDEVSIVMAAKPGLVKMKAVVDEMPMEAKLSYSIYPIPEEYRTKSGVMGKPSLATKEKGEKILDLTVEKIIEVIKKEFGEKYA